MSNHWIITVDHIAEPGAKPGTNSNAVGVASRGCRARVRSHSRIYRDGETLEVQFRAYDDDGELYYSGLMEEEDFHPLDDFCGPNAGCTELRYRRGSSAWKTL